MTAVVAQPLAAPPAPRAARDLKHFAYVDALRGIACIAVLTYHVGHNYAHIRNGHLPGPAIDLLDSLARGVQLFYVISAFTLFHSYAVRCRVDERPILFFGLRRLFRIAPMFFAALLLYTVTNHWVYHGPLPPAADLLVHFTFLHGFSPAYMCTIFSAGWSVGVEMAFYLIVPLLFAMITTLRAAAIFLLLTVMASRVVYWLVYPLHWNADENLWKQFLFFWLPNQLPVFAAGILLYFILQRMGQRPLTLPARSRRIGTVSMIGSLVLAALSTQTLFKVPSTYIVFAMAFVLLAVSLHFHPTRMLVNRFTLFLGTISYSIYLLHTLAIRVCESWLPSDNTTLGVHFFGLWGLAMGLTIVASVAGYYLIEMPGQRVGKRLITRLTRPSAGGV